MLERIAAKAGRILESVVAKAGDMMREELGAADTGRMVINRIGNVPDAFGRFTIDLGPARRIGSNPGNRPGTFAIDSSCGGGEMRIDPDGSAILRTNGATETFAYRSFRENNGSMRYLLYKPGLDAKNTLATMRDFYPGAKGEVGYFSQMEPTLRWDLSVDADAINRRIPLGSTVVGAGGLRQSWHVLDNHVPDGQALVIGPWRQYPRIPGILQPNQSTKIGSRQLEWFPLGENLSITQADADRVNERIIRAGFDVHDTKLANYIRIKDGSVWRIDPEEIVPRGQVPPSRARLLGQKPFWLEN